MLNRHRDDEPLRDEREARFELADLARRFDEIVRNPPTARDWRPATRARVR